jgi:thiamine biosynthesis lipoprotein
MMRTMTRRRFIGITAAAAGLELLPVKARERAAAVRWRGLALGAVASLEIHHPDQAAAEALIQRSLDELRRLEQLFSLYREDSALTALNRRSALEAPPADLVDLLVQARCYSELTDGAFDSTVQPLWMLYANHFSQANPAPDGPPATAVSAALAKISYERLLVSPDRIAFASRGMALTLNGIAQGYMTDRIVGLLRAGGIEHSLVNIGEHRALGPHPDGRPWTVGLTDPDHPERIAATIPLIDQAVATSGPYGFRFDAQGRFNHLLDPKTGKSAVRYHSMTVVMPTGTAADALSTAFSLLPTEAISAALKKIGHGQVYIISADGQQMIFSA